MISHSTQAQISTFFYALNHVEKITCDVLWTPVMYWNEAESRYEPRLTFSENDAAYLTSIPLVSSVAFCTDK